VELRNGGTADGVTAEPKSGGTADMHDDDKPKGYVLTRREALALLGAGGGALVAGAWPTSPVEWLSVAAAEQAATSTAGCIVRPEQTEGPYFVDRQLERADITTDPATGAKKDGVPFVLAFNVSQTASGSCTPLAGAMVDVWHCDAAGAYSGVSDGRMGFQTVGQKFLRGYQLTDQKGVVRFATIYPGWYPGRTVHIHFKVRTQATSGTYEFTSQLYFDDSLTDRIHARAPYSARGRRSTLNRNDDVFRSGGDRLLVVPRESGGSYAAAFEIALDLTDSAAARPDGNSFPFGRPGGPPPIR
jgi:protocatechuate 3,4-dioxygenase beta subunit